MTAKAAFQAMDPGFAAKVRASFAAQGLMTTLGATIVAVEPGHIVIEMPMGAGVAQQQGMFHGGAIGAIGDSAGGFAALTLMPAGSKVVTVEYKINFVRPATGQLLRAEGQVLRAGKSITVARIDVQSINDGVATTVALLQATFMRVAA